MKKTSKLPKEEIHKAEYYKKEYDRLMKVAVFEYDTDDSGNIDTGEDFKSVGQIKGVR